MRLGVAAVVALGLAACGSDETILEVDGTAVGADRVELVIAGAACQLGSGGGGCTVTGPSGAAASPVFLRDGLARTQATTDAGIARFQLEPAADGSTMIDKLVVVGWKGDQPAGFATVSSLPLDKPGIYQVALAAGSQNRAFAVWTNDDQAPTTAQYACVTAADHGSSSVTIVPAEDPDCDGFTGMQECPGGDHVYHYTQPVSLTGLEQATCSHDGSVSGGGQACRVGGNGCTDGMTDTAPDTTCQLSKFCVPRTVCATCPALDIGCIRAHVLAEDTQTPDMTIACPISEDDNGAPCSPTPAAPLIHLRVPSALRAASCANVTFMALDAMSSTGTNYTFTADLSWPANAGLPSPMLVQMPAMPPTPPAPASTCDVDFLIAATVGDLVAPTVYRAVARYELDNGFVAFVPMGVTFTPAGATGCPDGTVTDPFCEVTVPSQDGLGACFMPNSHP